LNKKKSYYFILIVAFIFLFKGNMSCTVENNDNPFDDEIIIPTGFSPNGVNKCFKILGVDKAEKAELIILDRYNNILFESSSIEKNSPDNCNGWWDGRNLSGKELPSGNYFYQLTINGDKVYNGYVVLKR